MSELRTIARGTPAPEWRNIYTVPNPSAGSDVSFAVPSKRAWRLLGVAATLTASSTAGNRVPTLTLTDATGVPLARIASPTNVVATDAPVCSWTPGVGAAVVIPATMVCLTLPGAWYMQTQEIVKITGHTATDDQWSNIRITVLETYIGDAVATLNREQAIQDHWTALTDLLVYGGE